jgi:hypothetical protein
MRQGTKRASSVVVITSLLAMTGVAGTAGVSNASPTSKACKTAKAQLRSAQKHHAAPAKIKRLQAKVKARCK